MYIPLGEGYLVLMAMTQQLGTTLRFPWPKRPCCQKTYCRYAACLKFSLFWGCSITRTSSRYLIAKSRTLPSKTRCWKRAVLDMHAIFVLQQHLFSSCVGITRHNPQLHQSGVSPAVGWDAPGSDCGWPCTAIYPFTKSAKTAGCLLNSSTASLRRTSTSRLSTKFWQWNIY